LNYYIGTNIFIYSALAHPVYGESCKQIVDDIQNQKIKAYCSFLVPIELLGALSRINPQKAGLALQAFFSLPINMLVVDEQVMQEAAKLTGESGVGYDSVHAACMCLKGLDKIVTEDAGDWKKFKQFTIIRPLEYKKTIKK
jgi:predicted nucleic acid-binding protein